MQFARAFCSTRNELNAASEARPQPSEVRPPNLLTATDGKLVSDTYLEPLGYRSTSSGSFQAALDVLRLASLESTSQFLPSFGRKLTGQPLSRLQVVSSRPHSNRRIKRIARKTGGLRCCGRWSAIGAAKTWLEVKELPQLARDLIGSQRTDVAKTQAKIGWRDEVGDGHHQAIQVG